MQQELRLLNQILEYSNAEVIILNRRQKARFLTARAADYVWKYFPHNGDKTESLPGDLRRWIRHQEDLMKASDVPQLRQPLVLESDGKCLVIRLRSDGNRSIILLEEQITAATRLRSLGLTGREVEVLTWVAHGKSNADIAKILSSSPRTVQKHLEHIFQKLGVETRTAAATFAYSQAI
jgi:DNA-binding NarL/FixJ family response regulator